MLYDVFECAICFLAVCATYIDEDAMIKERNEAILNFWHGCYGNTDNTEHRISYEDAKHRYLSMVDEIQAYADELDLSYDVAVRVLDNHKAWRNINAMVLLDDVLNAEVHIQYLLKKNLTNSN